MGDFSTYAKIRREISDLERDLSQGRPRDRKARDLRQVPKRAELEKRLNQIKQELRGHPCHRCPEREAHSRWGERWWKLRREVEDVIDQIDSRTNQVAKTFDRICNFLIDLEYLTEDKTGELEVTAFGTRLSMIYGERDLLVAESLRAGVWNELDSANLSAVVSTLVYESRRDEDASEPKTPKGAFEKAFLDTEDLWYNLELGAKHYKLKRSNELDLTVCYAVHRWANGKSLDSVLFESDMLVGDFIRLCKQIIDLLEQIARAADGKLRNTAIDSIDMMKRGIVAYSYYA